jgi:hypothetical protein
MVTVRTGDTEVACDRCSAANLDPRRRQMLSSRGSTSIMTLVTRPAHEDDAAHGHPSGQAPAASETELRLSVRVSLLMVFLPMRSVVESRP